MSWSCSSSFKLDLIGLFSSWTCNGFWHGKDIRHHWCLLATLAGANQTVLAALSQRLCRSFCFVCTLCVFVCWFLCNKNAKQCKDAILNDCQHFHNHNLCANRICFLHVLFCCVCWLVGWLGGFYTTQMNAKIRNNAKPKSIGGDSVFASWLVWHRASTTCTARTNLRSSTAM